MFHVPAHLNTRHPAAQVEIAPTKARVIRRIDPSRAQPYPPRRQAEPDLARMFDMAYEDQCAEACGP